jgi:hypothetical protein
VLDHCTLLAADPLLIMAVACTDVPDVIWLLGSEIDSVGVGADDEDPPHAMRDSTSAERIIATGRIWQSPSVGGSFRGLYTVNNW